ncbi:hypothetical protein, partial [Pseudomonas viridiflava]|uniref:hypothetical protein n=1 Tax=Pseudomonas viridiflava TaxID=33069 RepID=UPI00198003D3
NPALPQSWPRARTFIITIWVQQRIECAAVLPATAFEQCVHVNTFSTLSISLNPLFLIGLPLRHGLCIT